MDPIQDTECEKSVVQFQLPQGNCCISVDRECLADAQLARAHGLTPLRRRCRAGSGRNDGLGAVVARNLLGLAKVKHLY